MIEHASFPNAEAQSLQHEAEAGPLDQMVKLNDLRGGEFPCACMAGCESREDNAVLAPFLHAIHPGKRYRIVRSCTSDSVEYATLSVEKEPRALVRVRSVEALGEEADFALVESERLTALVLECLEAVKLSARKASGDGKKEHTETTAGGPWRETYS